MHNLIIVLVLIFAGWSCQAQQPEIPAIENQTTLEKTAAEDFGKLVARLSEEPGFFDTDNLISNESSYLHVIPKLRQLNLQGQAYLGVGPDQNFSYIAHLRPELAIILDIRRDNLLMHLFYKSLFELSDTRLDFLGLLFGRQIETDVSKTADWDVSTLMDEVEQSQSLGDALPALIEVIEATTLQHGVALEEADLVKMKQFHAEFIRLGPSLRFTSHGRPPRAFYPTYRQLAEEVSVDGEQESFLSKEAHFQFLKSLQMSDGIVPATGNFAGPHALKEIGVYLKEQNLSVNAFYTSNVEFYLMYRDYLNQYLSNVRQLPISEQGVFIRSYFNRFSASHPQSLPGYGSTQILQFINKALVASNPTYGDLIYNEIINY